MEKRRHHYIPQFYLNKFIDRRFKPPESAYLWVFEHGAVESKRKAPKNTAFEVGFYDVHIGKDIISNDVENNLANLESLASIIMKKIEKGGLPNRHEKQIFSEFIWTMQMRTTFQRSNQNNVIEDVHRYSLQIAANHPEYLQEALIASEATQEEVTDEKIKKMIDLICSNNYDVKIPQEYSILSMIDNAQQMSNIISKMHWSFLKSSDQDLLLTSDNPVVIVDPNGESNFLGPGYLNKNIELTFPLTPNLCLLATWKNDPDRFHNIDRYTVANTNDRTIRYSHKYVFSSMKLKLNPTDGLIYFES